MSSRHEVSVVPQQTPYLEPRMVVIRQPKTKYVLALETSSSMTRHELWKWVRLAATKLIRFDLPGGSRVALVAFSNASKIIQGVTVLEDDK